MGSRDPLETVLSRLDRPVRPDPAFEAELLERLVDQLTGGPETPRVDRRGGVGSKPLPSRARRLFMIAAMLAISGLAIALVLPLRYLGDGEVPSFGPPPTFRTTIRFMWPLSAEAVEEAPSEASLIPGTIQTATLVVSYASEVAWRMEVVEADSAVGAVGLLSSSAGSFGVWDGEILQTYDAATGTSGRQQVAAPSAFTPLALLGWEAGWADGCENGVRLPDATVAGRPALVLRCSDRGFEADVSVDAETGLVLGLVGRSGTYRSRGPLPFGEGWTLDTLAVEYAPAFDDGTFRFEPPEGTEPTSGPALTTLTFGEVAPSWSAPLLDGGTFDVAAARGSPLAVYAWASWCPPCTDGLPAVDASVSAFEGRVQVVAATVADTRQAVREFVDRVGPLETPIVVPENDELASAWGIEAVPTLVLLDAEGRFMGAYRGELSEPEMAQILQALSAGGALPDIGRAQGDHQLP